MKVNVFRLACLLVLGALLSACAGTFSGAFPRTEAQVAATDPQAPALDIQSWQTGEGAKVLFVASDALPMLDIRLVSDAGSARDGAHPGLASLTSALLGDPVVFRRCRMREILSSMPVPCSFLSPHLKERREERC